MRASLRSPRYRALQALLTDMRRAKGLTQAALADRLARPQSFVAKYEGGERRLDVFEFIDVARALGIEPHRILSKLATLLASEDD
jgi:transcriptional regulator with XRE-family HTH domain